MKTIIHLYGKASETEFREGPGHHHHVGQSHAVKTSDGRSGVFTRSFRTGPEGIVFSAGEAAVLIPTSELWKLVEAAEPRLRIPEVLDVPAKAGKTDEE